MADDKILFRVVVDDSGAVTSLQATRKGFKDLDLTVHNAKHAQEQLNKAMKQMGSGATLKNIKLTDQEYKKLIKTQNQVSDATGGATSAAMELGRVVSDFPYGIRGMANNITQLVSQLGNQAAATNTATGASYGYVGALKAMWTAMLGPLGVVLAITTVVSALDWLYGANKKAEKSTSDLESELRELSSTIRDGVNVSIEEYIQLMKDKQKVDKLVEESTKKIQKKEEELNKATERRIYLEGQVKERKEDNLAWSIWLAAATEKENKLNKELANIYREITKEIGKYDEAREKLLKKEDKSKGKVTMFSVEWYKQAISNLEKIRDKTATSTKEYKEQTREIDNLKEALKKLQGIQGEWKGERVKSIIDLTPPKDALKLAKKELEVIAKALNIDLKKDPLKIAPNLDIELSEEMKEKLAADLKSKVADIVAQSKLEDLQEYVKMFQDTMSSVSSFIDAEYERELTIEQNKTNALNEQLNNRLLNEKLSADKRKEIQNQIWQNDESLRRKQDEIAKKKFNTQKAFNIASAATDTYTAANQVLSDKSVPAWIKIPMAATTIASGLANVAAIARQKFQSSSAATPINTASSGGSGSGVGDRSFNFNLVGNNTENQLADAIQGQFSKPLKAFVVSKDITTQQELDANIKGTATI